MSARRGTASVSMNPPLLALRGMASFLTTNSQIEPHSVGALFVCKNYLRDFFCFFLYLIHTNAVLTQTHLFVQTFSLTYPIILTQHPFIQSLIENPCIHESLCYNRNIPRVLDRAERCGRVEIIGSRDNSETRGAISLAIVTWELQSRLGMSTKTEEGEAQWKQANVRCKMIKR